MYIRYQEVVRNRLGLGLFRLRLGICNGICCVKSLPQIVVLIAIKYVNLVSIY